MIRALLVTVGLLAASCQMPPPEQMPLPSVPDRPSAPPVIEAAAPLEPDPSLDLGTLRLAVAVAIDTSHSTRVAAGFDVDGDGTTGEDVVDELTGFASVSSDPADAVLAAEVAAASSLLETPLAPGRALALVAFSGERGVPADARVVVPLTRQTEQLRRGLAQILAEEATAMSNVAAGIDLAVEHLKGLPPGVTKSIFLLTDGVPTLPVPKWPRAPKPFSREEQDRLIEEGRRHAGTAALDAARRARSDGVQIQVFAFGEAAVDTPPLLHEIARLAGGSLTPVRGRRSLLDATAADWTGVAR